MLIFDTLPGLFIGIADLAPPPALPRLAPARREPRPGPGTSGQYTDLARHPDNEVVDGVVVLRVESGLFFANADAVRAHIRSAAAGAHAVVLETIPYVDVTAAQMLDDLGDDLRRDGVTLLIARDVGRVRDVIARSAVPEPGGAHRYATVAAAVAALTRRPGSGSG